MKKLLTTTILLCIVVITLGASTNLLTSFVKTTIDLTSLPTLKKVVIDGEEVPLGGISVKKLKKNLAEHDFASLSLEERIAIYQETRQDIGKSAFRNLLVGFGKGSQRQGDVAGHITGMVLDWTTLTVAGVGASIALIDFLVLAMFGQSPDMETDDVLKISVYAALGGAGAFVLGRIVQAILPTIYGSRYNKTLRNGLYLTKNMEDSTTALDFGFEPTLYLADERPTMGVKFVANLGFTP
ncbi:MAG: hypothetical protein GX842_02440 [Spirochaetales bacterium]|nr:hypothetical protein [Spirochaetales bacterium]